MRQNARPTLAVLAALALLSVAGSTIADEATPNTQPQAAAAAPAGPTPEEMAAWQASMAPGPAHARLEPTVGTWDVTIKHWMAPGAPPAESKGTSQQRWIMGGRWLEQRFTGAMMDMPFEGLGYTGYDNVQKKYVGTWMDSMGTGHMVVTGDADPSGKVITFKGSMWDPMTGKEVWSRNVLLIDGQDKHRFEMYMDDPAGKEFKVMEITYARAGAAAPTN